MVEKEKMYEKLLETSQAFMQAQIKPHFLNDALATISYLITKEPVKRRKNFWIFPIT